MLASKRGCKEALTKVLFSGPPKETEADCATANEKKQWKSNADTFELLNFSCYGMAYQIIRSLN